jgi:hypothetical protein
VKVLINIFLPFLYVFLWPQFGNLIVTLCSSYVTPSLKRCPRYITPRHGQRRNTISKSSSIFARALVAVGTCLFRGRYLVTGLQAAVCYGYQPCDRTNICDEHKGKLNQPLQFPFSPDLSDTGLL